jgi:hypothetical protein
MLLHGLDLERQLWVEPGGLIVVAPMAGMWCGGDSRFDRTLPPRQRLGAEIKNLIAGALMRPASANALAFVGDPADQGKPTPIRRTLLAAVPLMSYALQEIGTHRSCRANMVTIAALLTKTWQAPNQRQPSGSRQLLCSEPTFVATTNERR